jgi:ATP-dependent exoDNAse (exonuclease V) beta subunit
MTSGQRSISELMARIDRLFSDNAKSNQIRLSSVHKAKGLEADRVWIACSDKVPTWAKQSWEKEQEANLIYVARTRAKQQLALCLSPAEKGLETA